MKTFAATILEHETSRPLPGFLVTWYLTAERSVPDSYLDQSKWADLKKLGWAELNPSRIGSAVTNSAGQAALTFEGGSNDDVHRPNAWFTVQSPEVVGSKSCGQVAYAACEIRESPANYEEFAVRMPREIVQLNDLGLNSFVKVTANLTVSDIATELAKASTAPAVRPRRAPAFAKAFNERIAKAKQETEKLLQVRVLPVAVSLPVPFVARAASVTGAMQVVFDEDKGKLVVKQGSRGPTKDVSFDGVRRYTSARLTGTKFSRPRIEVDVATGKAQIALPRVPDTLELSETNPTRLFSFANAAGSTETEGEA
jgi:hypothetical protein